MGICYIVANHDRREFISGCSDAWINAPGYKSGSLCGPVAAVVMAHMMDGDWAGPQRIEVVSDEGGGSDRFFEIEDEYRDVTGDALCHPLIRGRHW